MSLLLRRGVPMIDLQVDQNLTNCPTQAVALRFLRSQDLDEFLRDTNAVFRLNLAGGSTMTELQPELESTQSRVGQVQPSDALDQFRFGAKLNTLAETPRAPGGNGGELPASTSNQTSTFDAAIDRQITQEIAGIAARLQECQNNTQRLALLQQTSQLIRRYGFHTSESAAQDFNRRMALAGAPSIQLVLNPDFAQPTDPIWHLRYRNTNPQNGDHPPIILPIP